MGVVQEVLELLSIWSSWVSVRQHCPEAGTSNHLLRPGCVLVDLCRPWPSLSIMCTAKRDVFIRTHYSQFVILVTGPLQQLTAMADPLGKIRNRLRRISTRSGTIVVVNILTDPFAILSLISCPTGDEDSLPRMATR